MVWRLKKASPKRAGACLYAFQFTKSSQTSHRTFCRLYHLIATEKTSIQITTKLAAAIAHRKNMFFLLQEKYDPNTFKFDLLRGKDRNLALLIKSYPILEVQLAMVSLTSSSMNETICSNSEAGSRIYGCRIHCVNVVGDCIASSSVEIDTSKLKRWKFMSVLAHVELIVSLEALPRTCNRGG